RSRGSVADRSRECAESAAVLECPGGSAELREKTAEAVPGVTALLGRVDLVLDGREAALDLDLHHLIDHVPPLDPARHAAERTNRIRHTILLWKNLPEPDVSGSGRARNRPYPTSCLTRGAAAARSGCSRSPGQASPCPPAPGSGSSRTSSSPRPCRGHG